MKATGPRSGLATACCAALALLPSRLAHAEDDVLDTLVTLPPVQVEGVRTVAPGRNTATAVRLDRAGVARFLPASVGDALISVPGVDLVKTGPWASRVSLRGLAGERVLLMVDGVRVNSVRGHGVQPSLVSLERLDAVELLPGASSAQFGSDALGGVVNFVTHRSLFEDRPAASLTLAARAAQPGDAGGESARLRFMSRALGVEVSGSLARLEALETPEGRIPNSGSREEDLAVRAAARLRSAVVDFEHTRHAARDVGLPAFNSAAGSNAEYPLQSRDADRLELTLPGSGARPDARLLAVLQTFRTHFTETAVDSVFLRGRPIATRATAAADRVRTRSWSVQPALHFGRLADLRLSGEARREETGGPRATDLTVRDAAGNVTSQTSDQGESVPPAWRETWSAAAFAVPLARPLRVESGLRYDVLRSHADSTANSATSELDVTDRRLSAEAGVARGFGPLEPYAHLASGFRAPNLEERYFNDDIHGGLRLFGNPDLRPERSVSYEVGLRATNAWGGRLPSARVSAFRSEVEDLISFRYIGQLYLVPRFQYVNVRRARLEGLEATARIQLGRVDLGLNASVPRGVDRETGKRLLDAGAARATLDGAVRTGPLPQGSVSVRVRWNDAVRDVDPQFTRPAFWTASLEAACVLAGTRAVFAVHNLLDHSYREPLSFIPEPGRTFALSLRRDFNLPVPFVAREP